MEKEISPILDLHEFTAAVATRAAQLENDDPPKVKVPVKVDSFESWDPVDIAKKEIREKLVGIELYRKTPHGVAKINTASMIIPDY